MGRDAEPMGVVEVRLAGTPAWRRSGQEWQGLSRKDAALLAVLAVDGPQTRDRLCTLLWPDTAPLQALASLRQRAHRLRKAAGLPLLVLDDLVRLAPGVVHDAGRWLQAAARPLGPFEYDDSEALAECVRHWREGWRDTRVRTLETDSRQSEALGDLAAALLAAQELVRLEPLQEHGWRRLMRLHVMRGERAAAQAVFKRCVAVLRDELGSQPDPQTLALHRQIDGGHAPPRGHGAAEAQQAAVPWHMPTALLRPPALIGREDALRSMVAAWAAGQPFVLLSPAGQGKTRLLHDFVAELPGVLWVAARAGDADAPYALAARWLQMLLRRPACQLTLFERRELSRLLPELGDAPQSAGHQGVLWRVVEQVLQRAVQDGLQVLALDDLHAADLASLELLRWLASSDSLASVRWALASRSDEGDGARLLAEWLGESRRPVAVRLQPWSRAQVCELLRALAYDEPDALADPLFAHAGGHPFFTLETLKELALQERKPDPRQRLPAPATVQSLIDRRLSRLSRQALDLMRVAAIAGPRGDAGLAARVLGGPSLDWASTLAELEACDVLRDGSFTHDLMREAVLRSIPQVVARELHAMVARALQAGQDIGGENVVRMAGHWEAAERWGEAGGAWQQAGLAARQAGRLGEQHALLQRAAEAHARAGDPASRFDALYAGIDSVLIREGGQAMLDEVERIAPLAATGLQRLLVGIGRADALLNLQRPAEALAETETVMRAADLLGRWRPDAMCLHGQALAYSGRADEALAVLRAAGALAAAAGDDVAGLHVASAMANTCIAASRQGEAAEAQREALERATRAGDAAEVALAQGNLATVYLTCGLPREAHAMAVAARASHAEMGSGDGVHAAVAAIAQGSAAMCLGRFDEAAEALAAAQAVLGERAGGAAHAKVQTMLACLALMQGRRSEALALLDHVLPDTPPVLAVVAHLVRWRAAEAFDAAAAAAAERAVRAYFERQPDLQRHPAVLIEWARRLPAAQAVALLDAVAASQTAAGASGVARSLRYLRALRLAESDPAAAAAQARDLLDDMPLGCHASLHLPSVLTHLRLLAQAQS